jgi:tyrosyl-DNA phosphodiesterase 1
MQDFPLKDDQSAASSPFERDLLAYFDELRLPPVLQQQTRAFISLHDFSAARAHLIASVPGEHFGNKMHAWGHLKLRACLESEAGGFESRFVSAPVLANYSSVGNLSAKWLENFRDTLCAGKSREGRALGVPNGPGLAGLHLVWPTVDEVRHSAEGWHAGKLFFLF